MLDPEDVAGAVVLACIRSPQSRTIEVQIEVQMRTMDEALT